MKRLLLSTLLLFAILTGYSQDQYSRVKIYANQEELQMLASKGLALDHGVFKAGVYVICELSQQELATVEASGIRYEMLIPDVSKFYADRNAPFIGHMDDLKRATYELSRDWPVPEGFELGTVGGFISIDECLAELDDMAAQYPDLISPKYTLNNQTHNGQDVYWIRLSDNPTQNEDEPEVLYTGMHHAREPIGMQNLMYFMWYLLENYSTDADCKYILDNFELYIVPIINMDGYAYNIQNDPNGGGMWRKNRRQNDDGSYGVDLNRNYGYMWGYDNGGSSPVPSDDTYRGPSAFSEPEIQNIRDFCNDNEFRLSLNYHAYANQTLYPWGYIATLCPDDAAFQAFSEILTYESGYEYGPACTTIYPTNGGSDDWMYGEQTTKGLQYSWTTEVGDGNAGFWPSSSQIIPLCQQNMWENMMLAKLAGPWATVTDLAPSILETTSGLLFFEIQRLGLEEGATYTVYIEPLNDAIDSVSPPIAFSDLELLQTESAAFSYYLKDGIKSGDAVDYLLTMDNGLITFSDTIHKIYGTPVVIFEDSATTFQKWTSSKWNVTTTQYHSSPKSIADSPTGQYNNYENNIITLNTTIDLSQTVFASLSFWAKWDIEAGYDYVQVFVSDNNGSTWTAMEGKYTTPGTDSQAPGQPVYDGAQSTWVKEEISLVQYLDKEIKIRFVLKSDSYVVADGFYWDDMAVTVIDLATGIPAGPQGETQNFASRPVVNLHPNPATDQVTITCTNSKLAGQARFMVYDLTGRLVADTQVKDNFNLDVSSWNAGMYFYNVVLDNSSLSTGKFIVK